MTFEFAGFRVEPRKDRFIPDERQEFHGGFSHRFAAVADTVHQRRWQRLKISDSGGAESTAISSDPPARFVQKALETRSERRSVLGKAETWSFFEHFETKGLISGLYSQQSRCERGTTGMRSSRPLPRSVSMKQHNLA